MKQVKIDHERAFLLLADEHDGSATRSSKGELWSFHAHLSLPNLRADTQVSLGPPEIEAPLGDYFDDLARQWQGWDDVKEWRAYEGGLRLACAHDGLGHIAMSVELREQSNHGWLARGDVPLDAGQLDQVARDLRDFERQ